jgi:hypothetical protein
MIKTFSIIKSYNFQSHLITKNNICQKLSKNIIHATFKIQSLTIE